MSSTADRFWSKVDKTKGEGSCWVWLASKDKDGYGWFTIRSPGSDRKTFAAHRIAWVLTSGQIPEGLCVLHTCDNSSCVNPQHLFLGTHFENHRDKVRKSRQARGKIHGRTKLTEDDVRSIRRLKSVGWLPHELGEAYGVSEAAVRLIVSRQNWGWLP